MRLPRGERGRTFTAGVVAALAAIYFIWGSTFLAIRIVVESLPPFLTAGVRVIVAGSVLYLWARARGAPAPTRREWRMGAWAGLFLFGGGQAALFWASQHVASGLVAVLDSTIPLWVVAIERLGSTRRIVQRRTLVGVSLGFAGIVWLNLPGARSGTVPAVSLVVLAGSVSWALGSVWYRGERRPSSALLAAALPMLTGGVFLLAASALAGESALAVASNLTPRSLLALTYLIVFGSLVAFSSFTWLIGRVSPTAVSSHAYVNPVVALALGWGLDGEALSPSAWGPIALVLGAVVLIITGER